MPNETAPASAATSITPAAAALAGVASTFRRTHRFLNQLVLIGVPIQVYAAGLALFAGTGFRMHNQLGRLMIAVSLLSVLVSLPARRLGASTGGALALFLLMMAQPMLVFVPRASLPALSAVHPVMALVVAVVAWRVEVRARG